MYIPAQSFEGIASMKALSKRCLLGVHIFHFSLGCFILLIFSCQIGMGDCCKWLHQQGVDLGATNNQGQARKSHRQMQFCNRRQMCSTCAVSCHGSMWVSLAEDTMLCTRPRMVVMQCCVRGCRSPSGKTWKTWFVFVFYVVYVVYLLVYDLLDPCLACSIFFQENADLDPHQKDVRHRSLVSWVLRKESKTPNRTQLHKLFKSCLEGADLCCPGQKGWLRGRGESLMNNMTSRRFFLLFLCRIYHANFLFKIDNRTNWRKIPK